MNRSIVMGGLAAAVGLAALSAPATASASCGDRKTTGTVIGGIGGALIGNSISGGGGGAIIGGIGGAVAGHEIAGAGCGRYRHAYYGHDRSYRSRDYGYRTQTYGPTRTVYYDQRGNPLPAGYAPAGYASGSYAQAGYRPGRCAPDQSYYDSRGNLVQQPGTCR